MADPFVAEIRIFPFTFAPMGWALCNGQLMPISQNTALFALLGTTYGGDGNSTFRLPDMQGNAPMHPGQGPGLSIRQLGETGGAASVSLLQSEIPLHTHTLSAQAVPLGSTAVPSSSATLTRPASGRLYHDTNVEPPESHSTVAMAPQALSVAGGGVPHNNMQPYLTMNFSIALQGIFPAHP